MNIPVKPALTDDILFKWQGIVDLMARIVGVPAGVIMRLNTPQIEVLVASVSEGNPYRNGDTDHFDAGHYCQSVMSSQAPLFVTNANDNSLWEHNPVAKLGMVAYMGLPLLWPDGEIFGTICVLDNKENQFSQDYRDLLAEFKQVVEGDLQKLVETEQQQKLTEMVLHESEERLANFFEASFEGLFLHESGEILDVNPATTAMFGYESKETVGKNLLEFVAVEFREIVMQQMAAGHEGPYEIAVIAKDKTKIPVEVRAKTVRLHGKPVRVVGLRDITDRKRAENALIESENRQNKAQEVGHVGTWDWNPNTGDLVWSNETYRVLGYVPQEIKPSYEKFLERVHPDDREYLIKAVEKAMQENEPYNLDCRIITKDGLVRFANAQGEVKFDEIGTPIRMLGTFQDITERKRTEASLEKSERKYRELIDEAATIILRWDVKGNVTFFNEYAQKFFGFTEEEILGKNVVGTIVPKTEFTGRDLALLMQEICLNPAKFEDNENENLKRNGDRVWIAWKNRPICNEAGDLVEIHSVGIDISARKYAEDALRQSEAKWRFITEHSPDHIMMVDRDGKILFINHTVSGLPREQVIGKPITSFLPSDYTHSTDEQLQKVWESGVPGQFTVEYQADDGSVQDFEANVGPVKDGEEVVSLIVSARDITERKRAVEAIRRAHDELELRVQERTAELKNTNDELKKEIAVRQLAELALKQERSLFVTGPTVVFKWRAEDGWPVEYVSPNVSSQFGYEPEDLISGKIPFAAIVHPVDLARISAEVRSYSDSGEPHFEQEYRIVDSDNNYRWLYDLTVVVRNHAGNITHYHGYVIDITERKQAEQRILASEGELRGILDSLQEVYYRADTCGNIVRVSSSMQKVFGYLPEEVIGKPTTMVWRYPEERREFLEAMKSGGGAVQNYEVQGVRKNGRFFWASINSHVYKDELGNVDGVEGTIRDVTQRRLAEEETQRSRQHFQSMDRVSQVLAAAPDLNAMLWNVLKEMLDIFSVDRVWLFYPCDPEAPHWNVPVEVTRTGYAGIFEKDVDIPRNLNIITVLKDALNTVEPVKIDYYRTETPPDLIRQYNIKTQLIIALHPKIDKPWLLGMHQCSHNREWTEYDERLFRDISERITHALTNRLLLGQLEKDIAERKRAEKELERQKTIFESMFRDVPDAMVLADTERKILMCNPALTRTFGYESSELIGEKTAILYKSVEDFERQGLLRFNLTAEEKAKPYVVDYLRKNNEVFPGETVGTAIKTSDGTTLGFIGVIRDISERVRAEEQAKLHQAELAHMARLNTMGELATGIAHELNQPLAAIANYAAASRRMFEAGIKHPEKMVTALESTQKQAERASEIIRRLRQFVKKQSPQKTNVNLNALVHDVVSFTEAESKRLGIQMQLELTEALPLVVADAIQIEQVLLNLTRNGLESMKLVDERSRQLTIRTLINKQEAVQVEVVDTGSGIDNDTLHKIFEPFVTTKGAQGMGMGLSISRSIIEAHDGKLWANSELGLGTGFYFTLPVVA